jgi:hypothetical protein
MNFLSNIRLDSSLLKGVSYGTRPRPFRDWSVLLGVLAMLLFLGTIWSAYVYASVKRGDVIGSGVVPQVPAVNTASIQSVEDLFVNRGLEAKKYEDGTYGFVDPSK